MADTGKMALPTSVSSQITDAVTTVHCPTPDGAAEADPAAEHPALAQTLPAGQRAVVKHEAATGSRAEVGRVAIVEVVEKAAQ